MLYFHDPLVTVSGPLRVAAKTTLLKGVALTQILARLLGLGRATQPNVRDD